MADPTGLDDLEAELRRMEEELAALKGKKPEKKAKKKDAPPADAAAAAPVEEAPKKRFGLPKLGKRSSDEAPAPAPLEAPAPAEAEPAPAAAPAPVAAAAPSGRWTREGRAWVRHDPARPPVHLRRILDADGRVVTEEPAPPELFAMRAVTRDTYDAAEVDVAPEAPPEKPLHSLAEKLGAKRKKGLFGRKKD